MMLASRAVLPRGSAAAASGVLRRSALLLAIACLLGLVAGCTKSEAQLSSEALQRGLEAQRAGDLDEAVENYRMAIRHDPTNVFAYYDLGLVSQQRGDPVDAENWYRLALSYDPDFAPALFNLALVRTDAGSLEEAVELYRRYALLRPDDVGVHLNLADVLSRLGRTEEAQDEYAIARGLDPSLPSFSPRPTDG
jgi:tetratricopeptide (TPR) repeat protein